MFRPAPEHKHWENIETGERIHPYLAYKHDPRNDIELVAQQSNDEGKIKRRVIIRDGEYEVWVQVEALDEYGYDLQPEETVSDAEFDAIVFKRELMEADSIIGETEPPATFEEADAKLQDALDDGEQDAINHRLIAHYYAAKMDPDVPDEMVEELRELMQEQTGHVDTSVPEVLGKTLDKAREGSS